MHAIFSSTPRSRRHRQSPTDQAELQPFFSPGQANKVSFFPPGIQRLATPDEEKMPGTNDQRMREDKMIQEKPEEEEMLQSKAEGSGGAAASPQISSRIESSRGQGQALSESTRAEMEAGIGADFSGVKVHTDSESVTLNKSLGAQAFTHGNDVYFNSGKYQPESVAGKRLLAHELTHVVQQKGPVQRKIQRSANTCTYGEVRQWAITSLTDFTAPAGLGDVKASIGSTCTAQNCHCVDGSTAAAPGDQHAWSNIVAAAGADLSNGANFMCVGSENCWFVHQCRPVYQPGQARPALRERAQNLVPVATLSLNGHSIYFYNDPLNGNCPQAAAPPARRR